jgi:hypothetical protein
VAAGESRRLARRSGGKAGGDGRAARRAPSRRMKAMVFHSAPSSIRVGHPPAGGCGDGRRALASNPPAGIAGVKGEEVLLSLRVIAAEVFPHLAPVSLAPGVHPPWRQRNRPQDTENPAHCYSLLLLNLGVNRLADRVGQPHACGRGAAGRLRE